MTIDKNQRGRELTAIDSNNIKKPFLSNKLRPSLEIQTNLFDDGPLSEKTVG